MLSKTSLEIVPFYALKTLPFLFATILQNETSQKFQIVEYMDMEGF